MKEGLIKDAYELIIKEIQTAITAVYIFAIGIGMLFNYQKYSEFDINIFAYSDVFDFLIAPFADFYLLFFATASIAFVSLLIKLDDLWKRKRPVSYAKWNFGDDSKSWFKTYRIVAIAITFVLYIYISADYYGKNAKTRVLEQDDISIRMEDNEIRSGKLIGKTKDVIFLLRDENVYAIPINASVKEIRIK